MKFGNYNHNKPDPMPTPRANSFVRGPFVNLPPVKLTNPAPNNKEKKKQTP